MSTSTCPPPSNLEQKLRTFNISFKEAKESIPKHCFERSLTRSLKHLAIDFAEVLFWLALQLLLVPYLWHAFDAMDSPYAPLLKYGLVPVVSLGCIWMQGVTQVSLWVLAHECGHGAFSPYDAVNDTIGLIVHSMLMVPFFGWQRSHGKHHHYTGNVIHDEVWVPQVLERDVAKGADKAHMAEFLAKRGLSQPRSRVASAWKLFVDCTISFIPKLFTLVMGATSRLFTPDVESAKAAAAKLAADKAKQVERKYPGVPAWKSALDGICIAAWISCLVYFTTQVGVATMIRAWLMPIVVTLFFLSMITFLHHTHDELPFFDDFEWDWFKAAVFNTIDRSMGRYLDARLHYITTTHIAHHVFSKIPFYHAEEATAALRKTLGVHYNRGESSSFFSWCADIWHSYRYCVAMVRRPSASGFWWYQPNKKAAEQPTVCKEEPGQ